MASVPQTILPNELPRDEIPPLEPGDRLTRAEFERRYAAMPQLKKAELIEGVVYMPSPVRIRRHSQPHARLIGWLVHYESATEGVAVGDNSTVRLDLDNEPQPDALLFIDPARGGQARISSDDYIESAPELVGEIASSSASYDLHTKHHVYRRNGVREYIVWRVLDRQIDWFVLGEGQYVPKPAEADGTLRSDAFPGLWLDATAMIQGNLARVFEVLQSGITTPEHATFVGRLKSNASQPRAL